jgi:hypothetical protein
VTGRRAPAGLDHDAWWAAFLPDDETLPRSRHLLPRREARRKLLALEAYRTQWIALDGAHRLLSRREVIRYEVSFELAPAGSRTRPALERRGAAR